MSDATLLKRILILDDDGDFRRLVKLYLSKLLPDVEVIEYDPVAQGAPSDDFDWSRYDALILDYYLCIHNVTGLDILQAHRKNKYFPATIMMTGAGNEEIAVRALRAGVYDYLRKEKFDKEQLKQALLTAVEKHQVVKARALEQTNHSHAFNKALFYQELEGGDEGESGKERVLLLVELDDHEVLEQRFGVIIRDNIVRYVAKQCYEYFKGTSADPQITRLNDQSVALLITEPDPLEPLSLTMTGICAYLQKNPYRFEDKKLRYTVSIGVVPVSYGSRRLKVGHSADALLKMARDCANIATSQAGNSFHIYEPKSAPPAEEELIPEPLPEPIPEPVAAESAEPMPAEPVPEETIAEIPAEISAEPVPDEIPEAIVAEPLSEEITEEIVAESVPEEIAKEIVAEPVPEEIAKEIVAEPVPEEIAEEIVAEPFPEEVAEEIVAEGATEPEIAATAAPVFEPAAEAPPAPVPKTQSRPARTSIIDEAAAQTFLSGSAPGIRPRPAPTVKPPATRPATPAPAVKPAAPRPTTPAPAVKPVAPHPAAPAPAVKPAAPHPAAPATAVKPAAPHPAAPATAVKPAAPRPAAPAAAVKPAASPAPARAAPAVTPARTPPPAVRPAAVPAPRAEAAVPPAARTVAAAHATPTPAAKAASHDELELDPAKLAPEALKLKIAFNDDRVTQLFRPLISLTNEGQVSEREIYRISLQLVDKNGNLTEEAEIYGVASDPDFRKFIDRWLLRETIGRVVSHKPDRYLFLLRLSEASLADPGLFNWLRKLLAGLDKRQPGKSIALELAAADFVELQKPATALMTYLHKSHGFRFALGQVNSTADAQAAAGQGSQFDMVLMHGKLLKELKSGAQHAQGPLLDQLRAQGKRIVVDDIQDATSLTDAIALGADLAMGRFVGEAIHQLEETSSVESLQIV
jgi:CheY-like chemotaxis protein/EAL domain-containing protein (putative c-di-GMP-specific phosphodiesterase class I)